MRSRLKNLGLTIGIIVLISFAIALFISLTVSNLGDLGRAFSDIQLQIIVIGVILFALSCLAIYSAARSKRLENSLQIKKQTKPIVGLRLRAKRSYQKTSQIKEGDSAWSANFWQGMSTEFGGAVITLFLGIGILIFDQYRAIQNRKDELILQLGSPDNGFALEASRILAHEGWLYDGTLQDIDLQGANLQGAVLIHANVQGVFLMDANLQDAVLLYVNLQDAVLWYANLQGANLEGANLQSADLTRTNLQGTNLEGANLQGTNLQGANLQGANLQDTVFDEYTILPDTHNSSNLREPSYTRFWTPETDMSRYTDPNHPDFWQRQSVINQQENP